MQLEETRKIESQYVRDEGGKLLLDKRRSRERWVQFFRLQLKAKSDLIDPDIVKRLPQQPAASASGIKPVAYAVRGCRLPSLVMAAGAH